MYKKFICIVISVVILLLTPIEGFASEELILSDIYDQDVSAQYLQDFLAIYDDSEYGGAYIDKTGKLIINLIDNDLEKLSYIKTINKRSKLTSSSKIGVEYVDYSMEYLKSVVDSITPYMDKMGILGVGINEKENCIELDVNKNTFKGINNLLTVNEINSKLSDSKEVCNLLIVNETELTLENTATMRPGSKFNSNGGSFTVAWGATISHSGANNGKEVFLIPGHAVGLNSNVYFGSTYVGKVIEQAWGGYYDVAYVENNNHTMLSTFANGQSLPQGSPYTNPPQGLSITAYGSVSGKQSGQILLTNYSTSVDGVTLQGCFKTSYKAVKGDSGAPVYSTVPVGMQSCSALSNNQWVSGSYSVCTSMYRLCARNSTHWIYLTTF